MKSKTKIAGRRNGKGGVGKPKLGGLKTGFLAMSGSGATVHSKPDSFAAYGAPKRGKKMY